MTFTWSSELSQTCLGHRVHPKAPDKRFCGVETDSVYGNSRRGADPTQLTGCSGDSPPEGAPQTPRLSVSFDLIGIIWV